jgi:septum formation protein
MISLPGKLVLASASPRRRELLESLGIDIEIAPSAYPEPAIPSATPQQLAMIHSLEKARDVAKNYPGRVVLAADTVVDIDAKLMLKRLAGRRHEVHTAFAIVRDQRCIAECSTTEVAMYPLSDAEIAEYVATGDPLDKAGSYGIQGRGAANIVGVTGDYFTVVGLPIALVVRALKKICA